MKDMQSLSDSRRINIDKVGIRNIEYPVSVKDRVNGAQNTTAVISMSASLNHRLKGTHMSRFVEILHKHQSNISIESINNILEDIRTNLDADAAYIELAFKYFIEKKAPVSGLTSLMNYECVYFGSDINGEKDFIYTVKVPVLSLCPCSKEISEYGAHNQRSEVSISVRTNKMVWLEELIEYAESSASSPIYSLLKREDEKYITEYSYNNPVFVEDIVRNITELLDRDPRVTWFEVSSENMESIHNHNAWALVLRDKRKS